MNAALTTSMTQLPEQLRKTLTWDRGKELSGHAQFAIDTGTKGMRREWPPPEGALVAVEVTSHGSSLSSVTASRSAAPTPRPVSSCTD